MFLPSCSVSVKAVYSSFAIWNRAHGHLLISLHPTCFRVQPRLNAERSQYKWRFQSIYLSVQPRLNARDRCKSDFILSVDIFREARRGLSDKYLLRSQRVSPIIYWAKIIQYNPHSISTKPFLSPLIFYWALFFSSSTESADNLTEVILNQQTPANKTLLILLTKRSCQRYPTQVFCRAVPGCVLALLKNGHQWDVVSPLTGTLQERKR